MTTPLNTWISVKDATPPIETKIIVYCYDEICESRFIKDKRANNRFRYYNDNDPIYHVTHWMLLSKPAK